MDQRPIQLRTPTVSAAESKEHVRLRIRRSVVPGISAAVVGLKISATDLQVRRVMQSMLLKTLLLAVLTYFSWQVVLLPAYMVLALGRFCFSGSTVAMDKLHDWAIFMTESTSTFVPVFMVMVARYILYSPLEKVFFATLHNVDPDVAADLKAMKPRGSIWLTLVTKLLRFLSLCMFYPVGAVFSLVPGIGSMIKFASHWLVLSRWTNPYVAVAAVACSMALPKERAQLFYKALQWYLADSIMFHELLYPFFCRALPKAKDQVAVVRRNALVAQSFVAGFSVALSLPYVGPFFWILASAAVPVCLILLDDGALVKRTTSKTH